MRCTLLAATICLLLVPCLVIAQNEASDQSALRVRAGWFDMGDADNGLGVGVDYLFNLYGQSWMVGLEWGDASAEAEVVQEAQATQEVADTYWGLSLNWIGKRLAKPDDPECTDSWYYGGGIGWYRVDDGDSDDSIGFQVLAGYNFAKNWSAEVRYVLGTEVFDDYDVDGLRISAGYTF